MNVAVMVRRGMFHVITSPERIPWKGIPLNSIQRRGNVPSDCHAGACRPLKIA